MIYELLSGGAALIGVGIIAFAIKRHDMAEGYQDDTGFHYGKEPIPVSTIPAPIAAPIGRVEFREIGVMRATSGATRDYLLTRNQAAVLSEMSDDLGHTAASLSLLTGLAEKTVTAIRKELAAAGLAFYGPLFDEDTGRPRGSGYLLTGDGTSVRRVLHNAAAGHVQAAV